MKKRLDDAKNNELALKCIKSQPQKSWYCIVVIKTKWSKNENVEHKKYAKKNNFRGYFSVFRVKKLILFEDLMDILPEFTEPNRFPL